MRGRRGRKRIRVADTDSDENGDSVQSLIRRQPVNSDGEEKRQLSRAAGTNRIYYCRYSTTIPMYTCQ